MNLLQVIQWLPVVLLLVISVTVAATSVVLMIRYYRQVLSGLGKACVAIWQAFTVVVMAIYANYRNFATFARNVLLTRGAFFRYAILICMSMSVVHGSHLFTTKNNIDALNLALAATFDIGTWVLMEAMISTRKRGYVGASIGILVSIVIVSGISFLANVAFNAHFYDAAQFEGFDLSAYGINTQALLIGAQSSPPLIIILMTLVAETFIKADIKEEVTYAQRIWSKQQKKIDREDAKLRLVSERAALREKYQTTDPEKEVRVVQPAWSFLGFTAYRETPEITDIANMAENIQKMNVAIANLQKNMVPQARILVSNTTANTESIQSSVDVIKSDDSPANTLVIIDELPAVQESNNWEIKQSINESITPVNTLVVEPVSGRLNTPSNSEVSKAVNTPVLSQENTEVDTQLNTTPNSESSNAVNTPVNTLVDTVVLNPVSNQADTEVSTPVNTPTNTDVNTHSDTPIVRDELDEYWSKVIAKYPAVIEWRSSGLSSVSVEQIAEVSGFSHQKIGRAKLASFNGGKKRIKSVLHWLSHQSPIKHVNSPVDTQVSRSLMNELNTEVITAVDTDVLELVSNPVDTSVNTGVDTEVLGGVNTPSDTDVEEEEISQELEPVIDPSDSDSTESIEQVDTDELPALDSEELDDQIVIVEENQPEVKPQVTRPLSLDDSPEELKEKDPVTDPEIVAIGD